MNSSPSRAAAAAVFPGSFDPVTNGHLDLIARARRLGGGLVVAVLENEAKKTLFSMDERVEMLREALKPHPEVEIGSFKGLLVDFAAARGAALIVRGIRGISDYEYELQMALMNRRLRPEIETIFLAAGDGLSFVSSRLVKEVAALGGNIEGLVPKFVEERLRRRLQIQ